MRGSRRRIDNVGGVQFRRIRSIGTGSRFPPLVRTNQIIYNNHSKSAAVGLAPLLDGAFTSLSFPSLLRIATLELVWGPRSSIYSRKTELKRHVLSINITLLHFSAADSTTPTQRTPVIQLYSHSIISQRRYPPACWVYRNHMPKCIKPHAIVAQVMWKNLTHFQVSLRELTTPRPKYTNKHITRNFSEYEKNRIEHFVLDKMWLILIDIK